MNCYGVISTVQLLLTVLVTVKTSDYISKLNVSKFGWYKQTYIRSNLKYCLLVLEFFISL